MCIDGGNMATRSAFHTRVDMFTHNLVFDINLGLYSFQFPSFMAHFII
jgi:hypothetical protein